jgi:uncharacterized membrane protein YccC
VASAREVLRRAATADDDDRMRSLVAAEVVLTSALSVSMEATAPLDPAWAAAAGHLAQLPPEIDPARAAVAAVTAGGPDDLPARRQALDDAGHLLRRDRAVRDESERGQRSLAGRLTEALSPHSIVLPAAARIGIAVAAGAGLGRLVGLDHAYWVELTAAAVLQATNTTLLIRRALARVAGTAGGVVLAWVILAQHPPVLVIAIVVVVALFIAVILVRASYGLAVIFTSVVGLAMFELTVPGAQIGAALGARRRRPGQVALAVDQLGMLALGLPFGRVQPPQADAEAVVARLDELAGAIESGTPLRRQPRTLPLPGYPRLRAATGLLAAGLGHATGGDRPSRG